MTNGLSRKRPSCLVLALLEQVQSESFWLESPAFADVFVRREAFENLEPSRVAMGIDEVAVYLELVMAGHRTRKATRHRRRNSRPIRSPILTLTSLRSRPPRARSTSMSPSTAPRSSPLCSWSRIQEGLLPLPFSKLRLQRSLQNSHVSHRQSVDGRRRPKAPARIAVWSGWGGCR
jgi:hypothetical protein